MCFPSAPIPQQTGTITEDGLDLWGVIPNGDGQFAESLSEPEKLPRGPLLETMASCHSLTRIEGELSGDPLDLKMFLSTNWVSFASIIIIGRASSSIPRKIRPERSAPTCLGHSGVAIPSDLTSFRRFASSTQASI